MRLSDGKDTLKTLRFALSLLGEQSEPWDPLFVGYAILGDGLCSSQLAVSLVVNRGEAGVLAIETVLPYPIAVDGVISLGAVDKLIEIDLGRCAWASPLLAKSTQSLLRLLFGDDSQKANLADLWQVDCSGDTAVGAWSRISEEAAQNLRTLVCKHLAAWAPKRWAQKARESIGLEGIGQGRRLTLEQIKALLFWALVVSLREDQAREPYMTIWGESELSYGQQDCCFMLAYAMANGSDTAIKETLRPNSRQLRCLSESGFLEGFQQGARLCMSLLMFNVFRLAATELLRAVFEEAESGADLQPLGEGSNAKFSRSWDGWHLVSREEHEDSPVSVTKDNPFSTVLGKLGPFT